MFCSRLLGNRRSGATDRNSTGSPDLSITAKSEEFRSNEGDRSFAMSQRSTGMDPSERALTLHGSRCCHLYNQLESTESAGMTLSMQEG